MKIKRRILRIVLIIVVSGALLSLLAALFKDRIVKAVACSQIEYITGFSAKLDLFDYDLADSSMELRGFSLSNPDDFPDKDALSFGRIYLQWDYGTLLATNVHFKNMHIELDQIVIVTKANGENNFMRLGEVLAEEAYRLLRRRGRIPEPSPSLMRETTNSPRSQRRNGFEPVKDVTIDCFHIKLGRIELREYDRNGAMLTHDIIDLDQEFTLKNVTNLQGMLSQLAVFVTIRASGLFEKPPNWLCWDGMLGLDGLPEFDRFLRKMLRFFSVL